MLTACVVAGRDMKEAKERWFESIRISDEAFGEVWCEIKSKSF